MAEILKNYIPKEISWLSFNARVMQEAENSDVPLIERIKFLGIYSNNLDEYFRVRVATLKRLAQVGKQAIDILGYDPKEVLPKIHDIVLEQRGKFEYIYSKIQSELEKENIFMLNEEELDKEQDELVHVYFQRKVRPKIMPIMISSPGDIPDLKDESIYFAVCFTTHDSKKEKYAIIELPTKILPRFFVLPEKGNKKFLILLDDVIRLGLRDTFSVFDLKEIKAYTIKLTKDAELDIHDDISESYVENVKNSLHRRKQGSPVRFLYDQNIPHSFLNLLMKRFHFKSHDAVIPGGRYHNFKDWIKFPDMGKKNLKYESLKVFRHPKLKDKASILASIKKQDIMLYYPYHTFDHFIDLLREASIDPKVKRIYLTLYRVAKESNVINALINAKRNGKEVIVLVELQARFDEEANISWSKKMHAENIRVIYGVPGLKVHSKLCLIERTENGRPVNYAGIGTGNFNEDTAKVYTDHMLLTADKKLTFDVKKIFNLFKLNYRRDRFNHLILSPFYLRNHLTRFIRKEIKNAQEGKDAWIKLKINNLVDKDIIALLYDASKAGVKIQLIVRGMFSLVAGKKKVSDNIEAIGVVDRFLEHTRFFIFCNDNDPKYFISSADWMTRNIDRRIEVTCPIYDKTIQKEVLKIFDIQWKDNVKARVLDEDLKNVYRKTKSKKNHRSQYEVWEYFKATTQANQ